MLRTLALTLVAATTAGLAIAQQDRPATTSNANANAKASDAKAVVSDQLFAAAAGIGGLAEVTISQIGVERATDPALKKFSQQMIEEHTKANTELAELAAKKGIQLPRTLDPRAQFCGQSLAGLSGEEFDRCYAKAQLIVHLDSVAMFEAEATRGQDPDIKAWAAKTLPRIQQHLAMIKPHAMKAEKEKPSTGNADAGHGDTEK